MKTNLGSYEIVDGRLCVEAALGLRTESVEAFIWRRVLSYFFILPGFVCPLSCAHRVLIQCVVLCCRYMYCSISVFV